MDYATDDELPCEGDHVEVMGGAFAGERGIVISSETAQQTRQVVTSQSTNDAPLFVVLELFGKEVSVRFPASLIRLLATILYFTMIGTVTSADASSQPSIRCTPELIPYYRSRTYRVDSAAGNKRGAGGRRNN